MAPIYALLVVKDPTLRSEWCAVLEKNGRLHLTACALAEEALGLLQKQPFQIFYTDLKLNDGCGVDLVRQVKQRCPAIYPLMGSSGGSAQDVIAAMQAGAVDFIIDPWQTELIETAIEKAVGDLSKQPGAATSGWKPGPAFLTQDEALGKILTMAKKVAPSTATILVSGESGTGKELLASFIHTHSNRAAEPYVALNCAALPEQLAESELFGHEKGSFTGAISRKVGKFEGAARGTLVLDEITEMALPLQAKLLRALQEREIVRLGSNRPIPIQARVIAISNRDLKQAVHNGELREDLFYRLNVIPLTIPPLRQRKNDIPLLAGHFLTRISEQNAAAMRRISEAAMEQLLQQSWPGNVRQLENAIARAVLLGSGETLLPAHLMLDDVAADPGQRVFAGVGTTVREMEKELIYNTLSAVNDNRTHAAKMLGISIRTLRNKLSEYRTACITPAL